MKILFLNLPYKFNISRASRWPEKTKSGTLYYPYWLAYCVGVCKEKGIEVNLIDCITRNFTLDDTLNAISSYGPDYIVCETTTPTCSYDYITINEIKNKFPNIKIICGGTHPTILPEEVLNKCKGIDIVVRQEYDFTVPEIIQAGNGHIVDDNHLKDIEGISYRTSEGSIVHNIDRPLVDLDKLPWVSKVYEEFLKEIFIEDDTFTVNKKRIMDFCDEIIKRNLKPVWSCNTRVDLDYETMAKMKQAGCRLLVCGYESGNQEVLDKTKKGITLEQSRNFAKAAHKLDIKVFGCFMIGLTGDNLETINQTYEFAKEVYPDMCFFQQAVPFPGTEFYNWAKSNGYLITEDYSKWLNEDGYLNCLVDYPYASPKEIEKIRDNLMSKYYFSFAYIFKTFIANLTWEELKRNVRGGSQYISFRIKKTLHKSNNE